MKENNDKGSCTVTISMSDKHYSATTTADIDAYEYRILVKVLDLMIKDGYGLKRALEAVVL